MSTSLLPESVESPLVPCDARAPLRVAASAATGRAWASDLYLDLFERFLVVGLFSWLVVRLVAAYLNTGNVGALVLLPSEGLVVVFMVIRRTSRQMSRRPGEWLMALGATCAPMLVAPGSGEGLIAVAGAGATLWLMGLLVQLHAKLTLGRSMGLVPGHRGLRLRGPYRFVRHPMYAGYLLSHLGWLLLHPSLWNLGVFGCCYALQIPRLLMEERLLSLDAEYRDYQAQVRFRLIPGVF